MNNYVHLLVYVWAYCVRQIVQSPVYIYICVHVYVYFTYCTVANATKVSADNSHRSTRPQVDR